MTAPGVAPAAANAATGSALVQGDRRAIGDAEQVDDVSVRFQLVELDCLHVGQWALRALRGCGGGRTNVDWGTWVSHSLHMVGGETNVVDEDEGSLHTQIRSEGGFVGHEALVGDTVELGPQSPEQITRQRPLLTFDVDA